MVMPESALILCVDDDRSALELRKKLLETNGFAVLATTSATQALKLFRANPVNLVVVGTHEHILSAFAGRWDEPKLVSLAFAIEQATHARRPPKFLPTLPPTMSLQTAPAAEPSITDLPPPLW